MITDIYLDEEMEMPCPCEVCGEWFDLLNGKGSLLKPNLIICASCRSDQEALVTTADKLKKGKRFIYNGDEFVVTKSYTKKTESITAVADYGSVRYFDESDEVIQVL